MLRETEKYRSQIASSSLKKSVIGSAIEELSMLDNFKPSDDIHNIPYVPFVSVCNLIFQVLEKIGPTMAVLRQDVHQNIQKLELIHETDPTTNSDLVEILKKETIEGNAKKAGSCSRAIIWVARSLDFTAALLQNYLTAGSDQSMDEIVENSYNITLKKWHGWILGTAVKVALKLVPAHKTFINAPMARDDQNLDSIKEEMQTLISLLAPLLEEIHSCLKAHGMDRLKSA